jgi:hypothetical protein
MLLLNMIDYIDVSVVFYADCTFYFKSICNQIDLKIRVIMRSMAGLMLAKQQLDNSKTSIF